MTVTASHEILLGDVNQEHHFHLNDGSVIKNIYELHDKLLDMTEQTFHHHVNKDRNDFKNWVHDVLKDRELANQLAKVKSRNEMIVEIDKRIKAMEKSKYRKICELRQHINCGLREFLAGIVLGIIVGLIIARLLM